jgi:[ribosomal protein S18]-alanine N-acetyltransferase
MTSEAFDIEVARLLEPGPDAAAIDAIARESFEASFSPIEELSRAWARVWVARAAAGEPVGFLVAWHVADELHVLNVAALSAARRRGIGGALVREAIAYAVASRVRLVLLEVRRSNTPAIRLYKKFAFHTSGLRERYYGDGEDAVEMALALDPDTGRVLAREDEISLDT